MPRAYKYGAAVFLHNNATTVVHHDDSTDGKNDILDIGNVSAVCERFCSVSGHEMLKCLYFYNQTKSVNQSITRSCLSSRATSRSNSNRACDDR